MTREYKRTQHYALMQEGYTSDESHEVLRLERDLLKATPGSVWFNEINDQLHALDARKCLQVSLARLDQRIKQSIRDLTTIDF